MPYARELGAKAEEDGMGEIKVKEGGRHSRLTGDVKSVALGMRVGR